MKKLICIVCSLFIGFDSFAQQPEIASLDNQANVISLYIPMACLNELNMELGDPTTSETDFQKKSLIIYPPLSKDYRKLGINTAMFFGGIVISFGILWTMPERVTGWDKQDMRDNGIIYKWKKNVALGPVWDGDNWTMNFLAHPYVGSVYYMTARGCGFSILESFVYSALMSTFFWEYGAEAFAQIPSTQDLIVTPVIGSAIGESFFYAKKSILENDKRVLKSRFLGKTTLFIIDPFNTVLDGLGYKEKVKTQMNIAPVGFDTCSNKIVWGVNFSARF